MKLQDFLDSESQDLEELAISSEIAVIKNNGLDIMLEGYGAKISGTNVVIVSGALVTPNSKYKNDFEIDASLTAILDCTDSTPDILYWESESYLPVVLHNYLTYLGSQTSYENILNLDIEVVSDIYKDASFEEVFAA